MGKVEARLEALRGAGIDINKWLQKAGDTNKNDQLQPSTLGELYGVRVHVCACLSTYYGMYTFVDNAAN